MGGLPANKTVYSVGVNAVEPKVIYVALREGVFKSTDAGQSWLKIGYEIENAYIAALAVHPANAKTVFAGTFNGTIFKIQDGGEKWSRQN